MNTYVCRRDGNALDWRTHEFRPGGELYCWHCEQRLRNGVPLLPERVETPIEALGKRAESRFLVVSRERYAQLTQGKAEAYAEKRRRQDRLRKQGEIARMLAERATKRRAHLEAIRPLALRSHWQKRAEQFALGA